MNHITGNDFRSRSSISESLIICLSRKNRPKSINHEVENNSKKLEVLQKTITALNLVFYMDCS
jgi:hypothetical protein